MAHSRYRLALIQGSLATLIFVGAAPISVTRPALSQTILDVFEALKDTVEKSKSRQGKEKTGRLSADARVSTAVHLPYIPADDFVTNGARNFDNRLGCLSKSDDG